MALTMQQQRPVLEREFEGTGSAGRLAALPRAPTWVSRGLAKSGSQDPYTEDAGDRDRDLR